MRASDLFGRAVLDRNGDHVGEVHDVRLSVGPGEIGTATRLPVRSLVVGSAAVGTRLGYVHGDVRGPWIIRWVIRLVSRRTREVSWGDVSALSDPLRLDVGRDDLPHPQDRS